MGCRQCILRGRGRLEKWTDMGADREGRWGEIAGVWRASLSLYQRQALSAQILSRGYLLQLPVRLSIRLSPAFLLRQMKEWPLFTQAPGFCFSPNGLALLCAVCSGFASGFAAVPWHFLNNGIFVQGIMSFVFWIVGDFHLYLRNHETLCDRN